jgi:hypothetical protein
VREHRDSIPEARGRVRGPPPDTTAVRLAPRHTSRQAVEGGVMARKRRAPTFAGALAQPIYVDMHQIDRIEEVLLARVPEKIKHYKIDPSDEQSWERLALQLAFEHVPGLQLAFRPKPGRKPTWKMGLDDELVRAVEDVKSRTGKRTGDAIAKLTKEPGGMWRRYTVENLGARYREAKHRQEKFRKLVEEARELRARGHVLDGLLGLLLTDEN